MLLATAIKCPTPVADKNTVASKPTNTPTRPHEAKNGDTNVHSRVAGIIYLVGPQSETSKPTCLQPKDKSEGSATWRPALFADVNVTLSCYPLSKPARVSTVEEGMALNTETAREPSPSNNQIIVYSSGGPGTEHVTAGCPWHERLNKRNRRSLLFATR